MYIVNMSELHSSDLQRAEAAAAAAAAAAEREKKSGYSSWFGSNNTNSPKTNKQLGHNLAFADMGFSGGRKNRKSKHSRKAKHSRKSRHSRKARRSHKSRK